MGLHTFIGQYLLLRFSKGIKGRCKFQKIVAFIERFKGVGGKL